MKKILVKIVIFTILVLNFSSYVVTLANESVNIFRPLNNEIVYDSSYIISGMAQNDDVAVKVYIKNNQTGNYQIVLNDNNESIWMIGSSGVFAEPVELINVGENHIKIVSFTINQNGESLGDEVTKIRVVTYLEKGVKDLIKESFDKISGMFSQFFK